MSRGTFDTGSHKQTGAVADSPGAGNTHILDAYLEEGDPVPHIVRRTLYLAVPLTTLFLILTQLVPKNLDFLHQLAGGVMGDIEAWRTYVDTRLRVSTEELLKHTLLITYISMYMAMWWVYFQSRLCDEADACGRLTRPLKIQSLRRLLGYSSMHWDSEPARSEQLVETYREKGNAGMQVLAILIAVSLLIIDKIVDILPFNSIDSLWKQVIVWLGLMSASVSFIGFVLCVDSFDTIFNRFKTEAVRNIMVHHFYKYTINPRYIATACMLFSLIMLLAYYSEVIASLAIGVLVVAGFKFWFPDLRATCRGLYKGLPPNTRHRRYKTLSFLLLVTPLVLQSVVAFLIGNA